MLFPEWPIIKSGVHYRTSLNRVETSNPCEAGLIAAFKERTSRDRPQLLKRFGKIAFKILSEMLALSFLNGVAAELDVLKIVQMGRGFRERLRRGLGRLSNHQIANCNDS